MKSHRGFRLAARPVYKEHRRAKQVLYGPLAASAPTTLSEQVPITQSLNDAAPSTAAHDWALHDHGRVMGIYGML